MQYFSLVISCDLICSWCGVFSAAKSLLSLLRSTHRFSLFLHTVFMSLIDRPPPKRPWGETFTYARTSRAPTRKPPSLSAATKASYGPIIDLIVHDTSDTMPSLYNLGELIDNDSSDTWTSTYAENRAKEYVQSCLGPDVTVAPRIEMIIKPSVDTLAVSPHQYPDGVSPAPPGDTPSTRPPSDFVYEVDSDNNWEATIDKLSVQLAKMLTSLRNCCDPIPDDMAMTGLYFPFKNQECVAKVSVRWSDDELRFIVTRQYLNKDEVPTSLKEVLATNKRSFNRKNVMPHDYDVLNYPLSSSFLEANHVKQLPSGQSIVLVNERDRKLYKYPMLSTERVALLNLLMGVYLRKSIPTLERSALPLDQQFIGSVEYFEFKLYDQPLSEEEAQRHKVWFVDEVVKAVNELHDRAHLAHLDIRLENICVDDETNQLILVDLDRSRRSSENVRYVRRLYGTHEMYNGLNTWTVSELDWKQVGLMIDEKICPHIRHDFVTKLIGEGLF